MFKVIFDSISKVGDVVANVVGKIFNASKDSVNTVIKDVLPFMVFISMIVGVINYTGAGRWLANIIAPAISSLPSMLLVGLICALPVVSPIIAPGAAIGQVASVLIGTQIANGSIPAMYSLPALFAINVQVGADFIPVGLSLAEAKQETIEIAVPAILFSKIITGPLAVLIAYGVSLAVRLYR
jgi:PTS system glucitol/sorbitol-specific IIC component